MTDFPGSLPPERPQLRSGTVPSQEVRAALPPSVAPRARPPRPVRVRTEPKEASVRRSPQRPLAKPVKAPTKAKVTKRPKRRSRLGGLSLSVRLIAAVTIVGFLALNLIPVGLRWYSQEQEYRAVEAQVEAARLRNLELGDTLAAWEDPDYVASQARTRLGFAWPGETQYSVVGLPEPDGAGESDALATDGGEGRPWSSVIMQSMIDADTPAASRDLDAMIAEIGAQ